MTDAWMDARYATLPEITEFAAKFPYAILPVGSFEQHGPHLPLDTDNIIAQHMAIETARHSVGLVLPCLSIGYAWVWRGKPGTLTLRFDTYMRVIRDVAESLEGWGIKALFVLSGHGSNPQPVKHAIRELIHEKHRIHVLNSLYLGQSEMLAEAEIKTWHERLPCRRDRDIADAGHRAGARADGKAAPTIRPYRRITASPNCRWAI